MSAKSDPRVELAGAEYSYRRSLNAREMLPAVAVGVVAGAIATYLVTIFLQRTPLVPRQLSTVQRRPRPTRMSGG
jgi:hypothetical protein